MGRHLRAFGGEPEKVGVFFRNTHLRRTRIDVPVAHTARKPTQNTFYSDCNLREHAAAQMVILTPFRGTFY